MIRVLAFDLSLTSTGWAACNEHGIISHGLLRPKTTGDARLEWFFNEFRILRDTHHPDLLLREDYAFDAKNRAHQIGELGGVFKIALSSRKHPRIDAAPQVIKKWATGKGNASKEDVLTEAVRQLGYPGSSNDEADALWLLDVGMHAWGYSRAQGKAPVQSRRDVLASIEWPTINGHKPGWTTPTPLPKRGAA